MESLNLSFKQPSQNIVQKSFTQVAKTPSLIKKSFSNIVNVVNKSLVQTKHSIFGDLIVVFVIAFIILILTAILKKFNIKLSEKRVLFPGKKLVLEGFRKENKIINLVPTKKNIDEMYYSKNKSNN